ncbi:hypothetical protein IPA_07940 [Ignicoccus pacificus DSM 13166]|uniref:N-methylhydantoinase A n=1 Tax=Ignicoccus pacificus DSM 13166 TaxID=940294 RepID=A0A977K9Z4_9CREN|nr:hypothetical protein IPA_07940 [Ignicoccus pacificus DSM 13166]
MWRVAVDVGGTFTDLFAVHTSGEFRRVKVLSVPDAPERGVINAIKKFLEEGIDPKEIGLVIHATTIATNAFLGQKKLKPAKVSLITTKGFEDVIEIQRQKRPKLYDFVGRKPKPLVPPELRFGVEERTTHTGEVLKGVNEKEILDLIPQLEGVVAVCFLHSYANPSNEKKVKEILEKAGFVVVTSYESVMERREYERFSTTIINAALKPLVASYIMRLENELRELGIEAPLFIVSSSGGLISVEEAIRRPGQLVESGPAGGAVGAAKYSERLGVEEILAFDMGGTTAKAAVAMKGEPMLTYEYEVGGEVHAGRLVKGSGYPIRYPFVDLAEVSAGGGTIAWAEEGVLRVGPISAGASPGPACYGLGGEEPTVTDADLILGRLPEELPSGLKLRKDLAMIAYAKLAYKLNSNAMDVAKAVIEGITEEMARAIRIVTVERGLDPADMVMVAYGGMGPLHGPELASYLGMKEVLIPPGAGVFTALGMLNTDAKYILSKTAVKNVKEDLEPLYLELEAEARERLSEAGLEVDLIKRTAEVRYQGQGWTLEVEVPRPYDPSKVARAFEELHERRYGFTLEDEIVVETIRVTAIHKIKPINLVPKRVRPEEVGETEMWVLGEGWVKGKVYKRFYEGEVEGPALVVDYDTTILIPPKWRAKALEDGSLYLKRS